MALVVAVNAGAQGTTIYEYPWNPDSNNDNLIGVDDLLDFLPVFGDEFGNPPEPCDYDGTPLEEFLFNSLEGTVIIDSIFVQFEIENSFEYYVIGCPDPVADTVIYSDAVTLGPMYILNTTNSTYFGLNGSPFVFRVYAYSNGNYSVVLTNNYVQANFDNNVFGSSQAITGSALPFPENWLFDDSGLHFDDWSGWLSYANYIHILPYWHYAE
jgi:hypothetical protein